MVHAEARHILVKTEDECNALKAEIEGGVEATVSVSDAVRTYSAVYRRRPPRVEVVAEALGGSGTTSPPLLEPRSLLSDPDDIFGAGSGGIQTVMIDPG